MKTRKKPDGVFRIICMGGSTTDQPTQHTADARPGILETMLTDAFRSRGGRIEVGAHGRAGDELMTFEDRLERAPQLVAQLRVLAPEVQHGNLAAAPAHGRAAFGSPGPGTPAR